MKKRRHVGSYFAYSCSFDFPLVRIQFSSALSLSLSLSLSSYILALCPSIELVDTIPHHTIQQANFNIKFLRGYKTCSFVEVHTRSPQSH